jgi:hypothetical protein
MESAKRHSNDGKHVAHNTFDEQLTDLSVKQCHQCRKTMTICRIVPRNRIVIAKLTTKAKKPNQPLKNTSPGLHDKHDKHAACHPDDVGR